MSIIKCPKCGCKRVERTALGKLEKGGTYATAVAGIAALKLTAHFFGLRTATPSWQSVKNGTDELNVPTQFKCKNCGNTFHSSDRR